MKDQKPTILSLFNMLQNKTYLYRSEESAYSVTTKLKIIARQTSENSVTILCQSFKTQFQSPL
ncbi:MAG: hypothetical protein COB04_05010 [Gammaproteobacteria bacterium]|nr:MAG: hypothetical protein COB04_05010 [Gammaproteobacteria bacterium]